MFALQIGNKKAIQITMLKQTAQIWQKTDQAVTWSSQAYIQWLYISMAQVRHKTWHQKQKICSI